MTACRSCGFRVAQYLGLCRTCGRAEGLYTLNTREQEAQRIARRHAALTYAPAPEPRPNRIVVIGHRVYEVVWDGSR